MTKKLYLNWVTDPVSLNYSGDKTLYAERIQFYKCKMILDF